MKRLNYQLLLMLLLLLPSILIGATFEAEVDKTIVGEGSRFTLTFVLKDGELSVEPNIEALKKDFIIHYKIGKSQAVVIINGDKSSTITWQVVISPRHLGKTVIPSISLGNLSTQPITMTVVPLSESERLRKENLAKRAFIEVEVDEKNPYVQAQVIITIRLYYQKDEVAGRVIEPISKDAIIKKLPNTNTREERNGQFYNVLIRKYVLFPQKSGQMKVISPGFEGAIRSRQVQMRDIAGFFQQTSDPLSLKEKDIILQVKPIPKAALNNAWLPAKAVSVSDDWPDMENAKVGRPITREINIEVVGQFSNQIGKVVIPLQDNVSVYRDKEENENDVLDGNVVGSRTEKIAYIIKDAGSVTLNEIRVPWFNTLTGMQEVAILPSKTIQITGSKNVVTTKVKTKPADYSEIESAKKQDTSESLSSSFPLYFILAIVLFALSVLIWVYYLMRKRTQSDNDSHEKEVSLRFVKKHLKISCNNNDIKGAKDSLIRWAYQIWPDKNISTLQGILPFIENSILFEEVTRLDKILYARDSKPWDGMSLWQAFAHFKVEKIKAVKETPLKPLYPNMD